QDVERRLRFDRAPHRFGVGDVEGQRFGAAAIAADFSGSRGNLDGGACRQHDVRAGLCQGRGGGEAHAAGSAGDQGASAVKPKGGGAGEGHREARDSSNNVHFGITVGKGPARAWGCERVDSTAIVWHPILAGWSDQLTSSWENEHGE